MIDLRVCYRSMLASPRLHISSAILLGTAVGFQTAVFSAVDTVLLRPLPFRDAERLVAIYEYKTRTEQAPTTFGNYFEWPRGMLPFAAMGAYAPGSPVLLGAGEPKSLDVTRVSASLFSTLGVRTVRGRAFSKDEETTGAPVAILNHAAWTQYFGQLDSVVGSPIELDGTTYTVIGVAPPELGLIVRTDVLVPFPHHVSGRGQRVVRVVGRLDKGASVAQAEQAVGRVVAGLEALHQDNDGFRFATVVPLRDTLLADVRGPITGFGLLTVIIFVAVTTNLVGLQFAHVESRARDMAIRAALGATRTRLVFQAVAESLGVIVAAFPVSVTVAFWLLSISRGLTTNSVVGQHLVLEPKALEFAGGISLVTGSIAAMCSVVMLRTRNLVGMLQRAATTTGTGRATQRAQGSILVLQTSLALLFLVFALALASDIWALTRTNAGFEIDNLWCVDIKTYGGSRGNIGDQGRQYAQIISEIRSLPGVSSVGAINSFPVTGPPLSLPLRIRDVPTSGSERVQMRLATPGYFETARVPLRLGRLFSAADDRSKGLVAVVNNAFVDRYWPRAYPLGRYVQIASSPWVQVIGVVGDVRRADARESPRPEVYLTPFQVSSSGEMTIVIRMMEGKLLGHGEVRTAVRGVALSLAVGRLATVGSLLAESRRPHYFAAAFLTALSFLAVALALAGTYSLVSYVVAGRRRELAVRRALGARERRLVFDVMAHTLGLIGLGIGLGIGLTLVLARVYANVIVGTRPLELPVLAAGAVLLFVLAAHAAYVPARRAVDAPLREAFQPL